ncbi:hypothetical protein OG21DRAFT_1510005, partial [Imleria badia]
MLVIKTRVSQGRKSEQEGGSKLKGRQDETENAGSDKRGILARSTTAISLVREQKDNLLSVRQDILSIWAKLARTTAVGAGRLE